MAEWDHIDENSGDWETVLIPVPAPLPQFSGEASYTLKNMKPGAVYDIIAKAKNKYGWSQLSKVFNFFNKGVGKYHGLFSDLPCNVLQGDSGQTVII